MSLVIQYRAEPLQGQDGAEKVDEDELTPEIVKEWMRRSSDVCLFLLFVFRAVMVTFCGSRLNRRQRYKRS